MDQESVPRLLQLHPAIRQDAFFAYKEAIGATPDNVHPFITSTMRTFKEQADLYARGRTKPGPIVTNSKPGQSYHNYGLALDFVIQIDGEDSWVVDRNWMIVVDCFKARGFFWGGEFQTFKDFPHLEKRLRFNWRALLALHDRHIFIPGGTFVDLTV